MEKHLLRKKRDSLEGASNVADAPVGQKQHFMEHGKEFTGWLMNRAHYGCTLFRCQT